MRLLFDSRDIARFQQLLAGHRRDRVTTGERVHRLGGRGLGCLVRLGPAIAVHLREVRGNDQQHQRKPKATITCRYADPSGPMA